MSAAELGPTGDGAADLRALRGELGGQADELDEAGRVRFGPAAGNSIPAEWVAPLLRRLYKAHPEAFGRQLLELYAEIRLEQPWTVARKRQRAG